MVDIDIKRLATTGEILENKMIYKEIKKLNKQIFILRVIFLILVLLILSYGLYRLVFYLFPSSDV